MSAKWALVTGASGGIGWDIAAELAERGYDLILVARSADKMEKLAQDLRTRLNRQIRTIPLDLGTRDAPDKLLRTTDGWKIEPEILVNNAGIGTYGTFLEQDRHDYQACVDLNVSTLMQLSHIYGRKMVKQQRGYILQVASIAAFQSLPQYSVYAASKAFVLSFSKALDYELRSHGVSSTALCPGLTETNFFQNAQHRLSKPAEATMMSSQEVAKQGVEAMFRREDVYIPGLINRVGSSLPRFLPSRIAMHAAALIMKDPGK